MNAFYVTGGTLRPDAPSYVERQADRDLLQGLRDGNFCYVLTSRQMGKSSLMVRTANRLRQEGCRVAVLDLTAIGQNLTPEQWYDGLLARVGRQLQLEDQLEAFWRTHENWGPVQRLFTALRDVALPQHPSPLVIFVDEIDTVRSLPFPTDEFFAAIRECYNRRTEDAEFNRLTFCLLGVATPSDLIRDTRMTPFNIGRRIELDDFSETEAWPLARGLRPLCRDVPASTSHAKACQLLLQRVLHWTNGHPYLTQRLCQELAGPNGAPPAAPSAPNPAATHLPQRHRRSVDRLCHELFLSTHARDRDDNLIFVRERLLRCEANTADLLSFYRRIRQRERRIPHDETNRLESLLRLAGIIRIHQGRLLLRNRIYRQAFNRSWIALHMPDAERRRQREAYLKGAVRAATVVIAVAAIIFFQLHRAEKTATRRLADSLVAAGGRLAFEGDLFGSLPWHARALELNAGDAQAETRDRIQIAATLRQCPRLVRMWFHRDRVDDVQFSPDGRYLITACADGTATVWDTTQHQAHGLVLAGHEQSVQAVAFSPDGHHILTGGDDRTILIWDAESGQRIEGARFEAPSAVKAARFDPTGTRVAVGCENGDAFIWDWQTNRRLGPYRPHQSHIFSVDFHPHQPWVLSASRDSTAQIWEIDSGQLVTAPFVHESWVYQARFSPDGTQILTADFRNKARLWNVETHQTLQIWRHEAAVRSVDFTPDGRYVATAGWDQNVQLRNVANSESVGPPLKSNASLFKIAFSPDGHRLVTANLLGVVSLWSLAPIHGQPPLLNVVYSRSGNRLATTHSPRIQIRDAATGQPVGPDIHPSPSICSWQLTPRGEHLLVLSTNGSQGILQLWQTDTAQAVGPPLNLEDIPDQVVLSDNASRLAVFTHATQTLNQQVLTHETVTIYDPRNGSLLASLPLAEITTNGLFSPDASILAVAGTQEVWLWHLPSAKPFTWTSPSGQVQHALTHTNFPTTAISTIEFHPKLPLLLVACLSFSTLYAESAYLWDLPSGQLAAPPLRHTDGLFSACFNAPGTRIATAGEDFIAQVWKLPSGQRDASPLKHKFQINRAVFSQDDRWVATASGDTTARVWDAKTGVPITPPLQHHSFVKDAQFVAGRRHLITRQEVDDGWRSWDLSPDQRPTRVLAQLAQLLCQHDVDEKGASYPLSKEALEGMWQQLRSQPECFLGLTELTAWHLREAELSEHSAQAQTSKAKSSSNPGILLEQAAKYWRAAVFHREQLQQLHPENTGNLRQLEAIRHTLQSTPTQSRSPLANDSSSPLTSGD